MKAIILAAGSGKRLAAMHWNKPKCLLPCPGGTLLDNMLLSLAENGIEEVAIVVGFERQLVEQAARHHRFRLSFIENPDYAATNTIHSLWLASKYLDDDVLYFNADIWFERPIISHLLALAQSAMVIDTARRDAESVKVIADSTDRITRIGKELPAEKCHGEFVGIAKFDRRLCTSIVDSLCRFNEELGQRNLYFESALDPLLGLHNVAVLPLGDLKAIEIDAPADYAAAKLRWT